MLVRVISCSDSHDDWIAADAGGGIPLSNSRCYHNQSNFFIGAAIGLIFTLQVYFMEQLFRNLDRLDVDDTGIKFVAIKLI